MVDSPGLGGEYWYRIGGVDGVEGVDGVDAEGRS
jgi:hypothetical protein